MTAPDVDALEAARAAATPGVWKLRGMTVHADQDGTSNADTAVLVAHTVYRDEHGKPRTWDADLICKMHAALPDLLATVRERDALRAAVEKLIAAAPVMWHGEYPVKAVPVSELLSLDALAAVDGGQ